MMQQKKIVQNTLWSVVQKKSTGELSRKHGINLNHEFSWYIYIRSLYKQAVAMILPTSRKAGYTPTEKDIMK